MRPFVLLVFCLGLAACDSTMAGLGRDMQTSGAKLEQRYDGPTAPSYPGSSAYSGPSYPGSSGYASPRYPDRPTNINPYSSGPTYPDEEP